MRYFVWGAIAFVAAAVIAAFFFVGSPAQKRLENFDERRVSDLSYLQSQIINYWQAKDQLPDSLEVLRDPVRGVAVPKDPQTGANYAYTVNSELSFSLCADFALASENRPEGYFGEPMYYDRAAYSWEHPAGRVCFERTIDPELHGAPVRPAPIAI